MQRGGAEALARGEEVAGPLPAGDERPSASARTSKKLIRVTAMP